MLSEKEKRELENFKMAADNIEHAIELSGKLIVAMDEDFYRENADFVDDAEIMVRHTLPNLRRVIRFYEAVEADPLRIPPD